MVLPVICQITESRTKAGEQLRLEGRRGPALRNLLTVLVLLLVCACSTAKPAPAGHGGKKPRPYKIAGKWYHPISHAGGFRQEGLASWYGKKFHGRRTANGEVYDMYAMTAAHKTLPLGTMVRVRNLENGREITVRVNDRGPFVRGRIIDLSHTGARKLGVLGPGTARVAVTALAEGKAANDLREPDFQRGNFTVQVGAFRDRGNALRLRNKLAVIYDNAHIISWHNGFATYHRVRIGRYTDLAPAKAFEERLIASGHAGAFTVAE